MQCLAKPLSVVARARQSNSVQHERHGLENLRNLWHYSGRNSRRGANPCRMQNPTGPVRRAPNSCPVNREHRESPPVTWVTTYPASQGGERPRLHVEGGKKACLNKMEGEADSKGPRPGPILVFAFLSGKRPRGRFLPPAQIERVASTLVDPASSICLSQRLSHASASARWVFGPTARLRTAQYNSLNSQVHARLFHAITSG